MFSLQNPAQIPLRLRRSAGLLWSLPRCGETHPGRQRERLFRASGAQKAYSLVYRAQSFFHSRFHSSWKDDEAAIVARTQLSNICRVKGGIFSRNVDLPNDGRPRKILPAPCRNKEDGPRPKQRHTTKAKPRTNI